LDKLEFTQDDAVFISQIINACLNTGKLYKESFINTIQNHTVNEIKNRIKSSIFNSEKYDYIYEDLNANDIKVLSYTVNEKIRYNFRDFYLSK
jgi:hypothetical protein